MIPQDRRIDADPNDYSFYQDPYSTYDQHRDGLLHYWNAYGLWCLLSFKGVSALLRDRRFARPDPASGPASSQLVDFRRVEQYSLLNLEPPEHTAVRSLVNHAFKKRSIETMRPEIRDLVRNTIGQFRDNRSVELLSEFARVIPATIISRLVGVPDQHIPSLLAWSNAMVKVYTMTQTHQDELEANLAARQFSELLTELIDQRRKSPTDDLLSHLVSARINNRTLKNEEVISTVVLLLNAGHEATVHQTGNAVKAILESSFNPQELLNTEEQRSLTVDELMRFDAPLHLFTRVAKTDLRLDGIDLKQGDQVALLLAAANRDPERFERPDQFDPFRKDGANLSLGAGVHFCAGAALAKMELEIMLSELFSALPDLTLAATPVYRDSFHFHGLQSLELTW